MFYGTRTTLGLVFLVSFNLSVMAQTNQSGYNPGIDNMIPPSPSAAALGKYGSIPIGLSTGIPSISIPVYEYSYPGMLDFRIELSYHAGGVKVDEVASNTGLGWSLVAGGVITRVMKGIPDETTSVGFWNSGSLPSNDYAGNEGSSTVFRKYNQIYAGDLDSEIDLFSFNFNGNSGRFVFGKNNDFLMLTQQNLRVEKLVQQISGKAVITRFTVTDDKGIKYIFSDAEKTTSNGIGYGASKEFNSSWYLTEIVHPSGQDKIIFTYDPTSYNYSVTTSLSMGVSPVGSNLAAAPSRASTLNQSIAGKRLKRIDFPTGEYVLLTYNPIQRTDLPGDYSLQKIQVHSHVGQKGVKLNQNYTLNRLTLNSVELTQGPYEQKIGSYLVDYFVGETLPNRLSARQDHWGFYNNNTTSNLMPAETFANPVGGYYSLPGGNRSTDPSKIRAASIAKITYPTKGYTVFELEVNRATDPRIGTNVAVGGLRAKKISDYDKDGLLLQSKEYSYTLEGSTNSSGTLGILPIYSYEVFYDFETPVAGGLPAPSYTFGTPNQVIRSTSPINEISYVNGSPVAYQRVVEKVIKGTGNEGYTVSWFRSFSDLDAIIENAFPVVPPNLRSWHYGLLTKQEVYSSGDQLLKRVINEYDFFSDNYATVPARYQNFMSLSLAPVKYLYLGSSFSYMGDYWTNQGSVTYFRSKVYLPVSGRGQLKKTTIEDFSGANSYAKTIDYTYDNSYYMKTSETHRNSLGELFVTNFTFPHHRVASNQDPSGVYAEMVQRNITSSVLETKTSKGTVFLNSTRVEFFKPLTNVYVPQTVFEKRGSNPEYITYSFTEYDIKGRLKTFKSTSGATFSSLLWDNFGNYMMAKTDNLSEGDKAYFTSFETNEKGGWTYSGTPLTITKMSGRKSYSLGLGAVSLSGIPASPSNRYKIAFWARANGTSATVNVSGQVETLSNVWTYVEKIITTTTVNLSGPDILIDDLRLHPIGAQMTTYTYEPISGITSSSDPSGRVILYDYDPFYRLKTVKDEQGRILEHFEYNYASGN